MALQVLRLIPCKFTSTPRAPLFPYTWSLWHGERTACVRGFVLFSNNSPMTEIQTKKRVKRFRSKFDYLQSCKKDIPRDRVSVLPPKHKWHHRLLHLPQMSPRAAYRLEYQLWGCPRMMRKKSALNLWTFAKVNFFILTVSTFRMEASCSNSSSLDIDSFRVFSSFASSRRKESTSSLFMTSDLSMSTRRS